jgi:quinohemoprotein ethanol dehydrogenase
LLSRSRQPEQRLTRTFRLLRLRHALAQGRRRGSRKYVFTLMLTTLVYAGTSLFPAASEELAAQAGEWASYGHDSAQQRFSALSSVDTNTIQKLGLRWSFDLPNETSLVATPLMVGETLFFTGKFSVVYAVSAATGRLRWVFDPKSRELMVAGGRRMTSNWGTSRGVAYWKGRIFVGAVDGRLIAVSARTGKQLWSTQTLDPSTPLSISGAPLIANDQVLIGNAGGDWGPPARGYVTAYDARTGQQRWRFYTVPGNPADGYESDAMQRAASTWGAEWWKYSGGGAVWNSMTFDRELNRVYIGTGNGSPWNQKIHGRAGGDNLFVASIVALDAASGKYQWHYQVVPGDDWDYDATVDIVLASIEIEGVPRQVLMQASKDGFFYVIDRRTGRLISAEKFVRVTWASAVDLQSGRPIEAPDVRPLNTKVAVAPSMLGGHNWPPMSFNPQTNLVYIPAIDLEQTYDARGIDPQSWTQTTPSVVYLGYSDIADHRDTVEKPAANLVEASSAAWLEARDPRTNHRVWRVKQPGFWAGGTLTTAGGLVFIGQAGGDLVAYDALSGAQLWTFACGRPLSAPPISYELKGTQYIAVLVGWGGTPGSEGSLGDPAMRMGYRDGQRRLLAFTLGGTTKLDIKPTKPPEPLNSAGFVADQSRVKRGEQIFDMTCSNCHGTNARSGGGAPDLRASTIASNLQTLKGVVLGGALQLQGMPRYADLSADDVQSLFHYIRFRAQQDSQASP